MKIASGVSGDEFTCCVTTWNMMMGVSASVAVWVSVDAYYVMFLCKRS